MSLEIKAKIQSSQNEEHPAMAKIPQDIEEELFKQAFEVRDRAYRKYIIGNILGNILSALINFIDAY